MSSFNALTKQQKLDIYSLIVDLNEAGVRVSTSVNRFDWLAVHVFLIDYDAVIQTIYIGGHEGKTFDEAYQELSEMLEKEND